MSNTHYRPDIQGLRAIAVLFHYNLAWLPGGVVGVDVFLVISDYLIVRALLRKKAQSDYQLIATCRVPDDWLLKNKRPLLHGRVVLQAVLATWQVSTKELPC